MSDDDIDDETEITDGPAIAPETGADGVDRFAEARALAAAAGGFVIDLPNHLLVHIPPPGGPAGRRLVVSFDNLASPRSQPPHLPWGHALFGKEGWGVLGVLARQGDFLRSEPLYDALERLAAQGLFASYGAVSMYGSSMGGYGAATFARLAPGCTVLAFAPQSTLDRDRAPFERRYPYAARMFDWKGRYSDAAEGIGAAGKAYLLYDPAVPEDRLHVRRLLAAKPDAIALRCPFMSHKLPPALLRMKLLKPVALEGLAGSLTPKGFYRAIRARRENTAHRLRVIAAAVARGHLPLAERAVRKSIVTAPNWKLRKLAAEIRQRRAGRL